MSLPLPALSVLRRRQHKADTKRRFDQIAAAHTHFEFLLDALAQDEKPTPGPEHLAAGLASGAPGRIKRALAYLVLLGPAHRHILEGWCPRHRDPEVHLFYKFAVARLHPGFGHPQPLACAA